MSDNNVTLQPDEAATEIGAAVARKFFDSRGNPSEIHMSEAAMADLVAITVETVFKLVSVKEVGA